MRRYRIYVDTFSVGLDELPKGLQSCHLSVLRVVAEAGRFSIFEATETPALAQTMTWLMNGARGYPAMLRDVGGGYPWTNVELTDAGRAALAAGRTPPVGHGRRPRQTVQDPPDERA